MRINLVLCLVVKTHLLKKGVFLLTLNQFTKVTKNELFVCVESNITGGGSYCFTAAGHQVAVKYVFFEIVDEQKDK